MKIWYTLFTVNKIKRGVYLIPTIYIERGYSEGDYDIELRFLNMKYLISVYRS